MMTEENANVIEKNQIKHLFVLYCLCVEAKLEIST